MSLQVVKIKSYVHATMSTLSPADDIRCIRCNYLKSRPIGEWGTLISYADWSARHHFKLNKPIVWGVR